MGPSKSQKSKTSHNSQWPWFPQIPNVNTVLFLTLRSLLIWRPESEKTGLSWGSQEVWIQSISITYTQWVPKTACWYWPYGHIYTLPRNVGQLGQFRMSIRPMVTYSLFVLFFNTLNFAYLFIFDSWIIIDIACVQHNVLTYVYSMQWPCLAN